MGAHGRPRRLRITALYGGKNILMLAVDAAQVIGALLALELGGVDARARDVRRPELAHQVGQIAVA